MFGWVLPQFIDYDAVFRAIGNISWWKWAVLIVIAAIRFIPEGWVYVAAQPGLSTSQGMQLVHEFRDQASDVLKSRTHLGLLTGLAARLAGFAVLIVAVRAVGIPADEVSWTIIFAAFAVVMAITVIPIFNLPGITELILISTLSRYAGDGFSDQIAAAVFVYRILTWLLPIPFGGIAFTRWRDRVRESGDQELFDAFSNPTTETGETTPT